MANIKRKPRNQPQAYQPQYSSIRQLPEILRGLGFECQSLRDVPRILRQCRIPCADAAQKYLDAYAQDHED